jgi:hypothetical protein
VLDSARHWIHPSRDLPIGFDEQGSDAARHRRRGDLRHIIETELARLRECILAHQQRQPLEIQRLELLPRQDTQLIEAHGARIDIHAHGHQVPIAAQVAKRRVIFLQCRQHQRQPGRFRMIFAHAAIDGAEETIAVHVDLVFLGTDAMVDRRLAGCGTHRLVRLGQFIAQRFADRGRRADQFDRVERVAIAFEQLRRIAREAQDLVAIGRLRDAQQRLDVEGVRDDEVLAYRPLQLEDLEEVRRRQHGQTVGAVIPEFAVAAQRLEPIQQGAHLALVVLLQQRAFHLPQQVLVTDRILQAVRMMAVRELVQRYARRPVLVQQR